MWSKKVFPIPYLSPIMLSIFNCYILFNNRIMVYKTIMHVLIVKKKKQAWFCTHTKAHSVIINIQLCGIFCKIFNAISWYIFAWKKKQYQWHTMGGGGGGGGEGEESVHSLLSSIVVCTRQQTILLATIIDLFFTKQ